MVRFVIQKVGEAVVVLFVVTLGVAGLTDLIPGSPVALIVGDTTQKAAMARLNHEYGYDQPFFQRYFKWLWRALHGDLGSSIQSGHSVLHILVQRLPITVELAVFALIVSLAIAMPLAMLCAAREGGWFDRVVTALSSISYAVPSFVGCVLAFELFANTARIFPTYGWVPISRSLGENLDHAALPVIVLCAGTTALFLRVLRGDLVSVLREDYILAARARGLPDSYILVRHVLRPASRSLFTVTGLAFGWLLGGSIIVENYFSLPGIGQGVAQAVSAKDLPVVQGVVIVVALVYLLLNTIVDLGQVALEPELKMRQND